MNDSELIRRLRLGEDSVLELKRVRVSGKRVKEPSQASVADELAALANAQGGTLVLGVDDKTRLAEGIPLEHLDVVETWIRNICNDSVKPSLDADILKQEAPDAEGHLVPVIRVEVPRGLDVHRSPGGYFRRLGSSKRELSPRALARLSQERGRSGLLHFDGSTVPDTTPGDLDYSLTRRFVQGAAAAMAETPEEELAVLRKMRIVTDDSDGCARLTLAGVLLCTREPQKWLPHAYVQAVAYAGERTDTAYQSDARDIGGSIDQQVEEALHFVRRNMLVRAAKQTGRSQRPQFSERAVFEALVNAVAHRDYSRHGARIRMHMFGNRLELLVPGGLANGLSTDSLHLVQSCRNEFLVSFAGTMPRGSGRGCGPQTLDGPKGRRRSDHSPGEPEAVGPVAGVQAGRRCRASTGDLGGPAVSAVKRIVCLANSRKLSGRCVAGRELAGGKAAGPWIRPVSVRPGQEVSEYERQYEDGTDPQVLDIVSVPVLAPKPDEWQTENWTLDAERYWKKLGRFSWFDLPCLLDPPEPLWIDGHSTYNGTNDKVPRDLLDSVSSSLRLVHMERLHLRVFAPGEAFGNSKRRVQARFSHAGSEYRIWVTDPVYERKYLSKLDGDYEIGECYLTVNLGEPYGGSCYKLAAAVIEEGR